MKQNKRTFTIYNIMGRRKEKKKAKCSGITAFEEALFFIRILFFFKKD